jgi:hypothetical protein
VAGLGLVGILAPSRTLGGTSVLHHEKEYDTSDLAASFAVWIGFLSSKKAEGAYAIKLVLEIAKNGTVRTVVAESAPTQEVKSRIEQQARDWIFEPYLKDGVGVNVKLSTIVHLNVIRSR